MSETNQNEWWNEFTRELFIKANDYKKTNSNPFTVLLLSYGSIIQDKIQVWGDALKKLITTLRNTNRNDYINAWFHQLWNEFELYDYEDTTIHALNQALGALNERNQNFDNTEKWFSNN